MSASQPAEGAYGSSSNGLPRKILSSLDGRAGEDRSGVDRAGASRLTREPSSSNNGAHDSSDHRRRVRDASSRIAFEMLAAADPAKAARSGDVEVLTAKLCERLAVASEERETIQVAARLSDIGMITLPRQLLRKRGPLDEAEWELIEDHPTMGERILSRIPELAAVATLVRHSHEHFDGSGYPDGIRGEQIPLGSRIILCADAFQAIRSDRPYRVGLPTGAAVAEIEAGSGTQFDPSVVMALSKTVATARRFGHTARGRLLPVALAVRGYG